MIWIFFVTLIIFQYHKMKPTIVLKIKLPIKKIIWIFFVFLMVFQEITFLRVPGQLPVECYTAGRIRVKIGDIKIITTYTWTMSTNRSQRHCPQSVCQRRDGTSADCFMKTLYARGILLIKYIVHIFMLFIFFRNNLYCVYLVNYFFFFYTKQIT